MLTLTQEQKNELLKDYNDRSNKIIDLEQKYHLARRNVARIAVEMGATPRNPKAYGKKKDGTQKKTCPKCRKTIEVHGARFCCFCGADIRSGREILLEKTQHILTYVVYLPENVREEARNVILQNIAYLQGEAGKKD